MELAKRTKSALTILSNWQEIWMYDFWEVEETQSHVMGDLHEESD